MNIGIDGHSLTGIFQGNRTYWINLLRNLRPWREDVSYHLFSFDPPAVQAELPGAHFRHHPLTFHRSSLRIPFEFPYHQWRRKLDLFHFLYVCPPVSLSPVVLTIHDILFEDFPEFYTPKFRKMAQAAWPMSARKARKVLTISEYSRQRLIQRYSLPPDKVKTIYCGVDDSVFRPIYNEAVLDLVKMRFGLQDPFLLSVGRLIPRKNYPVILKAFRRYLAKNPDSPFRLIIIGQKDENGTDMPALIRELGLESRVRVLENVTDTELPVIYNLATAVVYASFAEGFGLPIIEAMSCGTPVISSNTTAMMEAIDGAGLGFDPRSEEELFLHLDKLLGDPGFRGQVRVRCLEKAKQFRWENTARQTEEAYREVLGS